MNRTKRNLELAAAIISIVFGVILTLGAIIVISSLNLAIADPSKYGISEEQVGLLKLSRTISYILIVISIALIVVASMLCISPKENPRTGVYSNRFGLGITLCIMTGFMGVLELIGGQTIYGLLILIPCVLMIVSLCLKHNDFQNASMVYSPGMQFRPRVEEPKPEQKDTFENNDNNVKPQ